MRFGVGLGLDLGSGPGLGLGFGLGVGLGEGFGYLARSSALETAKRNRWASASSLRGKQLGLR